MMDLRRRPRTPGCPHCAAHPASIRELDIHLKFECPVLRADLVAESAAFADLVAARVAP